MIIEEPFFAIKCDNCKKINSGYDGYQFWSTKESALDVAMESDWIEEGDKNYCPDCYYYDDNDNLIIKNNENK